MRNVNGSHIFIYSIELILVHRRLWDFESPIVKSRETIGIEQRSSIYIYFLFSTTAINCLSAGHVLFHRRFEICILFFWFRMWCNFPFPHRSLWCSSRPLRQIVKIILISILTESKSKLHEKWAKINNSSSNHFASSVWFNLLSFSRCELTDLPLCCSEWSKRRIFPFQTFNRMRRTMCKARYMQMHSWNAEKKIFYFQKLVSRQNERKSKQALINNERLNCRCNGT